MSALVLKTNYLKFNTMYFTSIYLIYNGKGLKQKNLMLIYKVLFPGTDYRIF